MRKKEMKLQIAAHDCNLEEIKKALTKGWFSKAADINFRFDNNETALHIAMTKADENCVKFLLDNGASINAVNNNGKTPLMKAIKLKHIKIANLLIDSGADIEIETKSTVSAFTFALIIKNEKLAIRLLPQNLKLLETKIKGKSPFQVAIENNMVKLALLLADKNIDLRIDEGSGLFYPLTFCIEQNQLTLLETMLNKGADANYIDNKNKSVFIEAIRQNNLAAVELFIKFGAHTNGTDGQMGIPLIESIHTRNSKMVELLLNNGADPNLAAKGMLLPLFEAIHVSEIGIVRLLLNKGANPNNTNELSGLPLCEAIRTKNLEIVELMVKKGANVNAIDDTGQHPLFEACKSQNVGIFSYLIDHGAKLSVIKKEHSSFSSEMLFRLIKEEKEKEAIELVHDGAYLDDVFYDNDGVIEDSLLVKALFRNQRKLVCEMIIHGADVNKTPYRSAFSIACDRSFNEIILMLLALNVNPLETDGIDYLIINQKTEILDFIISQNQSTDWKSIILTKAINTLSVEVIKLLLSRCSKTDITQNIIDLLIRKGYNDLAKKAQSVLNGEKVNYKPDLIAEEVQKTILSIRAQFKWYDGKLDKSTIEEILKTVKKIGSKRFFKYFDIDQLMKFSEYDELSEYLEDRCSDFGSRILKTTETIKVDCERCHGSGERGWVRVPYTDRDWEKESCDSCGGLGYIEGIRFVYKLVN